MDPAPRGYIISVSDKYGYVGGFYSVEAATAALAEWEGVPLLYQVWRAGGEPRDMLWALPYTENGAVAFVTDRRESAADAQESLVRVGLVPNDPIDFWEVPANRVIAAADRRLRGYHSLFRRPAADVPGSRRESEKEGPGPAGTEAPASQFLAQIMALGLEAEGYAASVLEGNHASRSVGEALSSGLSGIGQSIVPTPAAIFSAGPAFSGGEGIEEAESPRGLDSERKDREAALGE